MNRSAWFAQQLTAAFLADDWNAETLESQARLLFFRKPLWTYSLIQEVLIQFPSKPIPREALPLTQAIDKFLTSDPKRKYPKTKRFFTPVATMLPRGGAAANWQVPNLPTPASVAEWLGLRLNQLDWFADCQGRGHRITEGPLQHYHYRWLHKRRGQYRLLEIPKARLKMIQRRIQREILDQIPPHEAAHGFRTGRSILTFATPHVGRRMVLRLDLKDFFPSIQRARVQAIFGTAGYPDGAAQVLAGLCTNSAPEDLSPSGVAATGNGWLAQKMYHRPHLPQGAPTSPALANLCAFQLDCRLSALAESVGVHYTRYADDLAFSGDNQWERRVARFHVTVCTIALEEGFEVHTRKSRFMRQGLRQQLAGIVLNIRPNVQRRNWERLKAILHNCIRHGPQSQNRAQHVNFQSYLRGHIAYVEMIHPERGRKLREMFEQILWRDGH